MMNSQFIKTIKWLAIVKDYLNAKKKFSHANFYVQILLFVTEVEI